LLAAHHQIIPVIPQRNPKQIPKCVYVHILAACDTQIGQTILRNPHVAVHESVKMEEGQPGCQQTKASQFWQACAVRISHEQA